MGISLLSPQSATTPRILTLKQIEEKKIAKKVRVCCVCYGQDFYFKFKRDEKCETGLIEAMATTSTTTSKIASLPLTVLLTLCKLINHFINF